MPRIKYVNWKPATQSVALVDAANGILAEYAEQGFDLTLRQLYYQFVARDLIPNTPKSYNNLGTVIQKARNAGLIDWDRIKDRGRKTSEHPHWSSGEDFLRKTADYFGLDLWEGQPRRCQVWVEKEALADVVERAAGRWDCSYFPNKGYVSASSIWASAQKMLNSDCNDWVVLHLGDHDPSGIDMTRDIRDRLDLYSTPYEDEHTRPEIEIRRIALNMDQIDQYGPPPNPAKVTDSRFATYSAKYGNESWELDALEPSVIVDLIESEIQDVLMDPDTYNDRHDEQERIREQLQTLELPEN